MNMLFLLILIHLFFMLNWVMIYTKTLHLHMICNKKQFKGRLIDGLWHMFTHAENPLYFAPIPIDFFEDCNTEIKSSYEFKKQWGNRKIYIIFFWIFLLLDVLVFIFLGN